MGVVVKGGLVGGLVKGCICNQLLRRLGESASAANVGGWKSEQGLIWNSRKIERTWQRNKVMGKAGQGGGNLGLLRTAEFQK